MDGKKKVRFSIVLVFIMGMIFSGAFANAETTDNALIQLINNNPLIKSYVDELKQTILKQEVTLQEQQKIITEQESVIQQQQDTINQLQLKIDNSYIYPKFKRSMTHDEALKLATERLGEPTAYHYYDDGSVEYSWETSDRDEFGYLLQTGPISLQINPNGLVKNWWINVYGFYGY